MEKREPSYTVGGNANWWSHCGKQYDGSLKKTKNRTSIWPSNSTPGYTPGKNMRTLTWKDTYTPMFIAALLITAKTWKQSKCPSIDDRLKRIWHINTTEYYSAIKKNEILPFAATWIELENTVLSEISQTEKDKYYQHMISLICGI